MIRLHLTTGPVVTFAEFAATADNFIELWSYIEERMLARGEL